MDFYELYKEWARNNGHAIMSHRKFASRIKGLGIHCRRKANGMHYACTVLSRLDPAVVSDMGDDPYDL